MRGPRTGRRDAPPRWDTQERLAPAPPGRHGRRRLWRTFASLESENFRWYFFAMMGNFTAMNMQMFIRGWLVYKLTGSFADLGTINLANGLSGLAFALVGGVVAERVRQKKHVLQTGQVLNACIALAIGWLLAVGQLSFAHLVLAAVVHGIVQNTIMPSRQALVPETVGMERLTNAIALNTSGMNVARLLMPGLAGWAVGALGGDRDIGAAQWVYFAMAGLYLSSVVSLRWLRVADRRIDASLQETPVRQLLDGFRYIGREPVIRMLLLANFFMVWFSMTYFMLLPGFAMEVLGAGAGRLGLLTSLSGVGSVVGALVIASLPERRRGLVLLSSSLLLGIALVAFAMSTAYWVSAAILMVVGLGQAGRMSLSNVLIQTYVADDYRGRVMSVYMMEFSLMSMGIFAMGHVADLIGPQLTVGGAAVALILLTTGLLRFAPGYRNLE